MVATGEAPSTLSRALGGFDGPFGSGVCEDDGAVCIDLSEVPRALTAVGEVVLKAAVRQPAGVIDVIVNEAGLEVEQIYDGLGQCHSIMVCRIK